MAEKIIEEFTRQILYRIDENTKKIISCLDQLDETEIWDRPNQNSNSVGNLILHLCGNIRQYAISSLGKLADVRERDKEFSAKGGISKKQLVEKLVTTLDDAKKVIQGINSPELLRERKVQGYNYSGIGILIHITEHYSYHTGQIVFWIKLLKNKDLGFYSGKNLNAKNQND